MAKILVFDDNATHRAAAIAQLSKDHDLTVVGTYDEAQKALGGALKFEVVLTDLMVPASAANQGPDGRRFVGQEMPLGTVIALLALGAGVKKVAVVTDTNHHNHPAAAALDVFPPEAFAVGDAKVVMTNYNVLQRCDAETLEIRDYDYLKTEEGKAKYPLNKITYEYEGTVWVKNWAKVLSQLLG